MEDQSGSEPAKRGIFFGMNNTKCPIKGSDYPRVIQSFPFLNDYALVNVLRFTRFVQPI